MTTQTSAQSGDQSVSDRASEVKDHAAEVGGTAQQKAGEVAGTAASRAGDVASTAKEQALDVAQEAQRQARDLFGEFRGQIQQQTQTQRDRLVELLREFEDELQNMVDAGGRSGTASEVVRQVAERLSGVRSYLEGGANPMQDVRTFARRRPGTFLLLAAAAGAVAGRATRGAAAARKQEQSGGRHAVEGYAPSSYGAGYSSASTGAYGTSAYPAGGAGTYSETTAGYRDQYGSGTSAGAPLAGVEMTSDPNLAPSSGTLTGGDTALGMPDSPTAPEYGGEGVGMPGPNAPTSDLDYDTDAQNRPTYGGSGSAEGTR